MPLPRAPRVALVLTGCGVHDGTDVHEGTLALLALDRAGARVVCAAPDAPQSDVVNHYTGERAPLETRAALAESARIARGAVVDLATLTPRELDAAIFPGGFGAVKTACDYARTARDARVLPSVAAFITAMHGAGKPLAFVCTAPVLAARVLGKFRPTLTVGRDAAMAADLEAWGAVHEPCAPRGVVVDRAQRVVSTPAYMLATRVSEVADGIDRAVRALLELV